MILSKNLVNRVSKTKEDLTWTKVRVISYHSPKSIDFVDPLACRCQDIGFRLNGLKKRIADAIFEYGSGSDSTPQINAACGAMSHMAKEMYKIGEEIQKRRAKI